MSDAGIAEHLSRRARFRLFKLVDREVRRKVDEERKRRREAGKEVGRGRPGYVKAVAERLGVSKRTVHKWRDQEFQAENPNAVRLVQEAWELNPREAEKILREDLEAHRQSLERFLGSPKKSESCKERESVA